MGVSERVGECVYGCLLYSHLQFDCEDVHEVQVVADGLQPVRGENIYKEKYMCIHIYIYLSRGHPSSSSE